MRIAIPMNGDQFSGHFGQSSAFRIYEIADGHGITRHWDLAVPDQGGCSVIPGLLAQNGVGVVLAGGIGAGAVSKLRLHGIQAVAGVQAGQPERIVQDYLQGQLTHTDAVCDHHEGHGHGHGHGGSCHGHGHRHAHEQEG